MNYEKPSEIRVVLIDDEAWTRDTIKRMGKWRELGCRIAGEASDGLSGLECIRQLDPQLIITDMKMPGLDGARMLRKLQEQELRAKVIIVSGYSDYSYTRQALTSHAVDYLLKPIQEEEFNQILEKCVTEIRSEARTESIRAVPSIIHGVDSSWMQQYQEARDAAKKSLDSLSEQGVAEAFSRILDLCRTCSPEVHLPLLIKINHDIHALIEEEIIGKTEETDRIFSPEAISFAVGDHKTADDMLEHYRKIIGDLIAFRFSEYQRSQRIDLRPICSYLDNHYQDPITLEEIAGRFSVSKEYLSGRFRRELNCTFTEYLTRARMEKAKELIVEYHIPLQKVPEMVGYIDIPHFYKNFKRYFGMTPGAMRDRRDADRSSSGTAE